MVGISLISVKGELLKYVLYSCGFVNLQLLTWMTLSCVQQKKPLKVSRGANLDYSKAVPTPLPLPSAAGLMHQEIESERSNGLLREEAVAEPENNKVSEHLRQEALSFDVDEEVEDNKEDESLREEQAAIQIQRAFRNHLVRFCMCRGAIQEGT